MPDEPETTPSKHSPVTSIVLSVAAALFGLLLSVWGLLAYGLIFGVYAGVKKLRKKPLPLSRRQALVPAGLLVAGILGSVAHSPVCAYMDYKIQQAHQDFGAELSAEKIEYEPVWFSVNYVGYELQAAGISAKTDSTRFWLNLVSGSIWDNYPIVIIPEDLKVEIEPAKIEAVGTHKLKLPFISTSNASVKIIQNDVTITLGIDQLNWMKNMWLLDFDECEVEYLDKHHHFNITGSATLGLRSNSLSVNTYNITIGHKSEFHALLQGGFGGDQKLLVTLDYLDLNALWTKYRIIDEHHGKARGKMIISGDWNNANIDWDIDLEGWSYYHKTAMGFNEDNSFRFENANCSGQITLGSKSDNQFHLTLKADGTLATGKKMNARGSGILEVFRLDGELSANVYMNVQSGEINTPISWSGTNGGLASITPNVILLAEELPHITVEYNIDVNNLAVNCEPLWGKLSGNLHGKLTRADGIKRSIIRADGKLILTDGRFAFLGTSGTVEGDIIFRKDNPIQYATLTGKLSGSTGSTPINARIRSQLSLPGIIFTSLRQSLPSLGKEIYTSGDFLEPIRVAKTTLLFGGNAAFKRDVFAKTNSRRSVIIGRE